MIYLLGMKLSRDSVSLENTAEPVLPFFILRSSHFL